MRTEDLEHARHLRIFEGVEEGQVANLLRGAFLQRFPAHVELVRENEPVDFLHLIVEGQVELFSAYRDRETTVGVLGPGQSFIAAAVLLDRRYLKSARTLTPTRVLMMPAGSVRACFAQDAAFARGLAIELAVSYCYLVKELKNQKLRSNLERLANWILVRDAETDSNGKFDLPFDKKVLAARLGMAPEVLSRSFAALAPYHVTVHGARIEFSDGEALRKLAQPSETIDDPVA